MATCSAKNWGFYCLRRKGMQILVAARIYAWGFPGGTVGEESACQCRRRKRCGSNAWVAKIPWSGKWQPTPVFLPRESHGQRSLVGYSPWGCKELDMTEHTCAHTHACTRTHTHTHTHTHRIYACPRIVPLRKTYFKE